MDHQEFSQAAETFLFSEEFQELRKALEFREPNLWQILGISQKEILVSSFLAWMLNPQSNHAFGAEFLKRFLIQALRTEAGQQTELRSVDILVTDFSEAVVDTEEWLGSRRCDILIHEKNAGFLCIIENKITSKEGLRQTEEYYQNSFQRFPSDQYAERLYIYLTPEGDPPQSAPFIPLSYEDILTCVTQVLEMRELSASEEFLLKQFQENILRGIAMDQKTRDLAQAIYDQHTDIIEFIIRTVERREESDELSIQRSWDGKTWFFNIGEKENSGYQWEDCRKYGFICAGGAKRYRDLMQRFTVDHVIYAYVSKRGYVGIGKITKKAVPFRDAELADGRRLVNLPLVGSYNDSLDDDVCDWIALIDWELAVEKADAVPQDTITRMTTSRIYEHRKNIANKVRSGLRLKSLSN